MWVGCVSVCPITINSTPLSIVSYLMSSDEVDAHICVNGYKNVGGTVQILCEIFAE